MHSFEIDIKSTYGVVVEWVDYRPARNFPSGIPPVIEIPTCVKRKKLINAII